MFPAAQLLTTARLVLTPLTPDDADDMVTVLADPRMNEFTGGAPLALDELRARYRALAVGLSADGIQRWCNWIVRLPGDQPVGVVQATVSVDGSAADVAWEIGVPWHGRGFAAEAARAIVDWLVGMGVGDVSANIHPRHDASAGIARRAGLAPTDELVDGEVVWRRPIDRRPVPGTPR